MTVHGIMKVWYDTHGDYGEVLDPLYKDREEAVRMKALMQEKEGERLQLVHFHVV